MKYSLGQQQIVRKMTEEGFVFREFVLEHTGRYAAGDADWNYKDIPHLQYVHELAEGVPTLVSDSYVTSLVTQKIFGLKFPLSVVNYESGPGEQTYYMTIFWFVLVIRTRFVEIEPLKTRVTTTYAVGTPKLLRWVFPFLRWTITRNYHVLMAADVPMRERRGELRSRGFSFRHEGASYSFADTQAILKTNVSAPAGRRETVSFDLAALVPANGEALLGSDDDLGLRACRDGDRIMLFPRLCPHEGSCLDASPVKNNTVSCPWHGRTFKPVCTVDLGATDASADYKTELVDVRVRGTTISITPLAARQAESRTEAS